MQKNTLTGCLRSIDGTSRCTYVAFTYYVPVIQKDEACWMVQSESVQYIIHLVNKTCNCKLFCTNCHACVCTCTLALHPMYTSYRNAVKGDFLCWTVIAHAWMQHTPCNSFQTYIWLKYLHHAGLSNTVECWFYRL